MLWLFIGIVVIALIVMLARRKSSNRDRQEANPPRSSPTKDAESVIAHQRIGSNFVPKTKTETDAIFAEEQTALPRLATLAKEAQKLARNFADAPDDQLDHYRTAAEAARLMAMGMETKIDSLFFEPENGVERYHRLMNQLDETSGDLCSAVDEIIQNRKDKEAGHIPLDQQQKKAPAKRRPAARKNR